MTIRAYSFHGWNLRVSAEAPVHDALHARLGRFPVGEPHDVAGLHLEFQPVTKTGGTELRRPAGAGRPVLAFGQGEVVYFDDSEQLYFEVPGRGQALCEATSRRLRVAYPEGAGDLWLLSHPFLTIALAELLKRLGLFMVHAAGLAVAGKGLLVAGQSGAGKTTLSLALLRAGFDFLGDDTVFLTSNGGGLRVLAFPDEVDVTPQTLAFFPELRHLASAAAPQGRLKQAVCAANLYPVRPCWECVPQVVLFPQPGKSRQSRLIPMPKAEALLQLVCNVLRTEPLSSQAHLDGLAALVSSCRCYRLHTGRDFDRLPGLLRHTLN